MRYEHDEKKRPIGRNSSSSQHQLCADGFQRGHTLVIEDDDLREAQGGTIPCSSRNECVKSVRVRVASQETRAVGDLWVTSRDLLIADRPQRLDATEATDALNERLAQVVHQSDRGIFHARSDEAQEFRELVLSHADGINEGRLVFARSDGKQSEALLFGKSDALVFQELDRARESSHVNEMNDTKEESPR